METQIFKSVPFTTPKWGWGGRFRVFNSNKNGDILNTVKKSFLYKVIYKLNISSVQSLSHV